MTRKEATDLYGWLKDSYPRNYKDADARRTATTIDNLAKVFGPYTYREVQEAYEKVFMYQKNEPHPSEIRATLRGEREELRAEGVEDPYEMLRKHPKWAEFCNAYGERAVRRAAKLCVQTGTCSELKFQLEHDTPCREGRFH